MPVPTYDQYVASLGRLSAKSDPTAVTAHTIAIKDAAYALQGLDETTAESLTAWIHENPHAVPVLGLVAGLSQEKLKNILNHHFGTAGWITLARTRASELIQLLDEEYDLIRQVTTQRLREYDFGDVLVGRAGTRVTATKAGEQGRKVEDEIEAIAKSLGLPYEARTRFTGKGGVTAPCDLVIPNAAYPLIIVAAKGFDSTGSKLSDAVTEIAEVARVRLPRHYVMAVIDGIGWKARKADLRRFHQMWVDQEIDGMYTLATLEQFKDDLRQAAVRAGLLAP